MIRAYIPWYLARNYLVFAFVACLGALQIARARREGTSYAFGIAILVGASFGFYALAPELLTPGPAGGEMTFLFGGAALLAVALTCLAAGIYGRAFAKTPRTPGLSNSNLAPGANGQLKAPGFEPPATASAPAAQSVPNPAITAGFATKGSPAGAKSEVNSLRRLKRKAGASVWHLMLPLLSLLAVYLDVPLFHFLNGLALRTPLMDMPVQFLMNDYIVPTALVVALLALWFAGRDGGERLDLQQAVLRALAALAFASIGLKLINEVYFRPRPFTFDDSVRLLFYHPSDSSLPSNAATVCFALSIAVWLRQKRWGAVMLALSVGMTLARVVGGVHYPADIVAGAWWGGVSAWLVNRATWLDRPLDRIAGSARRLRLG